MELRKVGFFGLFTSPDCVDATITTISGVSIPEPDLVSAVTLWLDECPS